MKSWNPSSLLHILRTEHISHPNFCSGCRTQRCKLILFSMKLGVATHNRPAVTLVFWKFNWIQQCFPQSHHKGVIREENAIYIINVPYVICMLTQIFNIPVFLYWHFIFHPFFLCNSISNNWISPLTVGRGKPGGNFSMQKLFVDIWSVRSIPSLHVLYHSLEITETCFFIQPGLDPAFVINFRSIIPFCVNKWH